MVPARALSGRVCGTLGSMAGSRQGFGVRAQVFCEAVRGAAGEATRGEDRYSSGAHFGYVQLAECANEVYVFVLMYLLEFSGGEVAIRSYAQVCPVNVRVSVNE